MSLHLVEVQLNSRYLSDNMLIPGFVYILSFCVWEESHFLV